MQNSLKEKNFIQRNKWWSALGIVILVSVSYVLFFGKKTTVIESVEVTRHDISEVVSTTGNVKPLSDLDLSFETSGQVAQVKVSVGDKVYQGERLASLSNADLIAAV